MIEESATQNSMRASLDTGYDTLSVSEKITFIRYKRYILPIDGYIFWIKDTAADPLVVDGSFHYSTEQNQLVDETIGINRVVLTTAEQIQNFNTIENNVVYIGTKDSIRFAFNANGKFYTAAGIWHYSGTAVYPAMLSQIIDNPTDPISIPQIATNSLPIWLSLNSFSSTVIPYPTKTGTLYPSFLIPSNLPPPYLGVDITETDCLEASPYIDKTSNHSQLMREKVKITMYGLSNNNALDCVDFINQYSLEYDNIGIMNMPRILDEKRTQSELGIIAQKKSIEYEVSYYQNRAQDISRQLILHCLPNFIFN